MTDMTTQTTLVLGGTGKTGRRVAQRLAALGRPVRVGSRSGRPQYAAAAAGQGVPAAAVMLLTYLFSEVLDGRNAYVADGVRRALGREPRDFAGYARDVAASGVWDVPVASRAGR